MLLRLPRPPQDDHYRFAQMQAVIDRATDSVLALMSILEVYEIALPGFKIFQGELARVRQRADKAFSELTETVWFFIPQQPGAAPEKWPPGKDDYDHLSNLADEAIKASIELHAVVWDLRIQAQKHLMGPLFPAHEISERQPGDPSVKVIRLA